MKKEIIQYGRDLNMKILSYLFLDFIFLNLPIRLIRIFGAGNENFKKCFLPLIRLSSDACKFIKLDRLGRCWWKEANRTEARKGIRK